MTQPKHVPSNVELATYADGKALPDGAVVLNESDVLNMQLRIIKNYVPKKDIRPLTYAQHYSAVGGGIGGLFFSLYYRPRFNLFFHGRFLTVIPTTAIPALGTAAVHLMYVTYPMLLKKESCLSCLQVRSASLAVFCGVISPLTLSWLSCLYMSKMKYTTKLPPRLNFPAWFKFFKHQNKQIGPVLMLVTLINLTIGAVTPYREIQAAENIWAKM